MSDQVFYDYTSEAGELIYQVVRGPNKSFKQRRPGETLGTWIYNLQGVKPLLYRLPEIIEAVQSGEMVFLAEGEKDSDNLAKLALAATTN